MIIVGVPVALDCPVSTRVGRSPARMGRMRPRPGPGPKSLQTAPAGGPVALSVDRIRSGKVWVALLLCFVHLSPVIGVFFCPGPGPGMRQ